MIRPFQQDERFLGDVARGPHSPGHFKLWWLGQSGFLLRYGMETILLDPYLSDSLTRKYQDTDKPHKRISDRVVSAYDLRGITLITSSHNHTDHLDRDTILPVLEKSPKAEIVVGKANVGSAGERLGLPPSRFIPLSVGNTVCLRGLKITAIPAAHNELERDAEGEFVYMGFVIEFGSYCIYHSGDTLYYDGITHFLKKFKIDVAILPINGDLPERRVAGNLDGAEAARLGREMGARIVIPCHYDLFEFNTVSPDLFEENCRNLGQAYRTLLIGEGLSSSELG
jgi:L-ascorbate metabolism protein UlaG (beta-lactamase superfamily)